MLRVYVFKNTNEVLPEILDSKTMTANLYQLDINIAIAC